MKVLSAALLGALFGVGLLLSGMTDPARVRGFLDIAGRWDPSLAFVMGGALLVSLPAFTLIRRRKTAILGGPIVDPKGRVLDPAAGGLSAFVQAPVLSSWASRRRGSLFFWRQWR